MAARNKKTAAAKVSKKIVGPTRHRIKKEQVRIWHELEQHLPKLDRFLGGLNFKSDWAVGGDALVRQIDGTEVEIIFDGGVDVWRMGVQVSFYNNNNHGYDTWYVTRRTEDGIIRAVEKCLAMQEKVLAEKPLDEALDNVSDLVRWAEARDLTAAKRRKIKAAAERLASLL